MADVLALVVNSPDATGKTFEVRRSEALDGKRPQGMSAREYRRLLLKLSPGERATQPRQHERCITAPSLGH